MSEENQKKSPAPSKSTALTKEDILRITSLPVKKMRVGNIVQDVVCDEATPVYSIDWTKDGQNTTRKK